MASFTTMEAAESRAKAKVADRTWVNAHSARAADGTIIVRFQRYLTTSFSLTQGGWETTSDDSVV